MAYTLRYYKTFPQPGERDILLEIYEKDGVRPSQEIGSVVQALHLDIQGAQDDVDTPIVKTSLTIVFVDAPDHEESATKKCGNWEEFYTPDSTYWQVILKVRNSQGSFTQIWGGYVTPDSFSEQLRYRGSVTIVARDNIGHMQDFPFDATGNEDGMITVYDLVNAAWSKIESPMRIDWRGVGDSAIWLQSEGTDAPATYVNVSAFEGMNWYEAVQKVLYSMGMVMRYVGKNVVQVSSLRYMPYMGEESISDLNIIEPIFVSSANRELAPAAKRIEESVSYHLEKGVQIPLADGVDFAGTETTAPFYSTNIFGETIITNIPVHPILSANGDGWSNMPSSTLFFDPRRYTIREDGLNDDVKRMLYLACNTDGSRSVGYHKTVICRDFRISLTFGRVIQRRGNDVVYCYGFASGTENNGIGSIRVRKVSGYISAEQYGVTHYYTGSGWQADPYKIEMESQEDGFGIDIGFQGMTGVAVVSFFIESIELDAMRDYSDGEGLYVPISSMYWGLLDGQSLCVTNSVNTNYIDTNNVIISRSPEIAPALDEVPFPVIIKNGIFVKSGDAYLPAKLWAWYGGTPQQMAVYNHLQLLCYHSKPNNVITGDIVNADLGDIRALYLWHGKEHLMQGGSLNFLNGRIEGAILREFTRYESLWGDVTGDAGLPDVESANTTNVQEGSSASTSGYENNTEVYIGGEGGSITVDSFMSDTSRNPVENRVIKAYVDSETKKAQAAAEQYIQDEVLTDYATTEYVEEREEYLVGYTEEWVTDLEKDIKDNPQNYIGLKTINNQSLFGSGNLEVKTTVEWNDIVGRPTNLSEFTNDKGYITEVTERMIVDATDAIPNSGKVLISTGGTLNWLPYPRNLSDLTDDVVAGKYLPLSGGTIKSPSHLPLLIETTSDTNYATIRFVTLSTQRTLGIKGDGTLFVTNVGSWGAEYPILHSGNVGEYALKNYGNQGAVDFNNVLYGGFQYVSGSSSNAPKYRVLASFCVSDSAWQIAGGCGDSLLQYRGSNGTSDSWSAWKTIAFTDSNVASADYATSAGNADTLDGYHADTMVKSYLSNTDDFTRFTNRAFFQTTYINGQGDFGSLVIPTWSGNTESRYYTTELRFDNGSKNPKIRVTDPNGTSDWYTLARTVDNVTSATKLQTPRTIWGQSFDGTGDVSGDITMNNYTAIKFKNVAGTSALNEMMVDGNNYLTIGYDQAANSLPTRIDGSQIFLRYGSSHTNGLILNSSGNVTIGEYELAGTGYKLYVSGRSYFSTNNYYGHYVRLGAGGAYGLHIETRENGRTYFQSQRFDSTTAYYDLVLQELGGNVGIGVESPQYKLDVAGTGRFTGLASFDAGVKIGTTTLGNTNLGLSINTSFYPSSVGLSLGHSSYRWHNVFANNVLTDEVKIGEATLTWGTKDMSISKPIVVNTSVTSPLLASTGSILASTYIKAQMYVEAPHLEVGNTIMLNGKQISSWDEIGGGDITIVEQTTTSGSVAINPNVINRWGTLTSGNNITISFQGAVSGVANYYMIEFTVGSTTPTITLPSDVAWMNSYNILANLLPNTKYQISVMNNLAVGGAFN